MCVRSDRLADIRCDIISRALAGNVEPINLGAKKIDGYFSNSPLVVGGSYTLRTSTPALAFIRMKHQYIT